MSRLDRSTSSSSERTDAPARASSSILRDRSELLRVASLRRTISSASRAFSRPRAIVVAASWAKASDGSGTSSRAPRETEDADQFVLAMQPDEQQRADPGVDQLAPRDRVERKAIDRSAHHAADRGERPDGGRVRPSDIAGDVLEGRGDVLDRDHLPDPAVGQHDRAVIRAGRRHDGVEGALREGRFRTCLAGRGRQGAQQREIPFEAGAQGVRPRRWRLRGPRRLRGRQARPALARRYPSPRELGADGRGTTAPGDRSRVRPAGGGPGRDRTRRDRALRPLLVHCDGRDWG